MTQSRKLSRWELWVADHAAPIFAVLAVLIVAGAAAVFIVYQEQGDTAGRVKVLSPQVTRINRAICDRRSLKDDARARRCAERIRVGLVNCRGSARCRAALLAIITYPPPARGATPVTSPGSRDAPEASSPPAPSTGDTTAHAPESSPGSHHDGSDGPEHPQKQPPVASPGLSPPAGGPAAPEPPPEPGTGADGGSEGGQGGATSGAGVEVCVLEGTCVGLEVGGDPKGLTLEPPIRREGPPPGAPAATP